MDNPKPTKLTVRGCNIGLMRGGAGRPLLFLHGGERRGPWLPFMADLAARHDVIVPEHPGFGASDTPDWLDNIHDLAYFYLDFLDQLDLDGVDLVGFSLGGWIAAELAVRNTRRLASLTLVGAAGIHVPGVPQVDTVPASATSSASATCSTIRSAPTRCSRELKRPELEDVVLKNRTTTAQARLAAARLRSAPAQMAAPDRRADAAGLGRQRPAVPEGLCATPTSG